MADTLRKEVIWEGNGTDKPKAGDTVTMDYTGWLYDNNEPHNRGKVCVRQMFLDRCMLTGETALIHPKTAGSSKPRSVSRK